MLSGEEMLALLMPIASRWKEVAEKLGLGEDHVDEVFTNNESDQDCLCNITDVYHQRVTVSSLVATLKEMGETDLAERCRADKQGD